MTIEEHFKEIAMKVRNELQGIDSLYSFNLKLKASGHIHQGDMDITISIGESEYDAGVKGNNVDVVLDEFKRRHGWTTVNAPLCISYSNTYTPELVTVDE